MRYALDFVFSFCIPVHHGDFIAISVVTSQNLKFVLRDVTFIEINSNEIKLRIIDP
jgi:hypothetical protein